MTILYHVTPDLNHNGQFFPRIPEHRIEGEDASIKRVCVSTSIEGCLSAMPSGVFGLEELLLQQPNKQLKIFKIDTEKLDLSEQVILDNHFLYENELVIDAVDTEEHWILKPFRVSAQDTFIVQIDSWAEYDTDLIPHFIHELANTKYHYNPTDPYSALRDAYRAIYDTYIPSGICISNVEYSIIEPVIEA